MGFPDKAKIKKALEKLEGVEGTLSLPKHPTALEKFRWELCQKFTIYKQKNNLTQREMAALLSIDEGKVSKIVHHRIDEFSTDRLISLYEKLDPKVILKVS